MYEAVDNGTWKCVCMDVLAQTVRWDIGCVSRYLVDDPLARLSMATSS